jgi:thioesterase domain-containing protein/acyl carrier protein
MSEDDILFDAVFDAWRETLPNGEFEPDRSLADTGVDSLKAMELILRIERTLNRRIPFAMLTAETTPRSLALGLSRGGRLEPSVDKPVLFFMPGINGHALQMVQAWQAVVEEIQLMPMDAPGLDRPRVLLTDLPATAAEVAADIARRQPEGDIRLMGYSFGAALAYEVAGQFRAQGRRVAFLCLVDLLPVRGLFMRLVHALFSPAALGRKLAWRLPRLGHAREDPATQTLLIQAAIRFDSRGLASRLARAKAEREGLDAGVADRLEIHHWRGEALRHWRPAPIDVPALLIASDDGVLAGSPQFWQNKIPGLRVARVAGSHDTLTTGPVDASVAQALREGLYLPCQ